MAILTPVRKGKRLPSFRGRLVISARKGKIVARKWPRKRGAARTQFQKDRQEWFKQANILAKYAPARQQALSRCTMNHLPVRPYDALIAAMAGRLWAVEADDGRTLYSMASRGDVSLNLDILNQEPGRLLIRGPKFWVPFEWGELDQYIASQGPDVPPIWKDVPAGGGGGAGVLAFGSETRMADTTTRFYGVGILQASENRANMPAVRAMTVKNLSTVVDFDPRAGGTLVVTFRKNGADTPLTVSFAPGDFQKSNTVNTVDLVAGDLYDVKVTTVSYGITVAINTAVEAV